MPKRIRDQDASDDEQSDMQCYFWDFVVKEANTDRASLVAHLKKIAKHWVFQLEKGEKTGYVHYQGRLSLWKKKRMGYVITQYAFPQISWERTSTNGSKTFSYVMKEDTRVEGPWADTDPVPQPPPRQIREFREMTLWPWQEAVAELAVQWDKRRINVIYDASGNNGKTTFRMHLQFSGLARTIPYCNDYKDLLRMVMDLPTAPCYFFDLPRAMGKEKLLQFWSAVETIKDGYAYDDRYSFKEKYFDCPQVFVITNQVPESSMLSNDRWNIWTIIDKKLEKFSPPIEKNGEA